MAKDVKVVISLAKPVTGTGFGYPLIFEGKATTFIDYTECYDIDDVIKAVGKITDSDDEETVATKTATAKESNIYKAALLIFMQDNAPEKIAVYATSSSATTGLAALMHHGWRQVIVTSVGVEGEDTRKAISDYIETTEKMYFTSVEKALNLSGQSAISGNERTVIMCHDDDNTLITFPEAALVGVAASKVAGSFTYKNLMLKGLTPKVLSDSQINEIHNANAMAFVLKCGDGVTSEGKTTSGEYIDIIDAKDYIIQNIEYQTQKLLNQSDKIPYDNSGIARLETVCVNVLRDAANNGLIALTDEGVYDYSVSYKARSETKGADRAERKYVEGSFRFALAGAIHTVEIKGTIEI
jgi:hypothetical protein